MLSRWVTTRFPEMSRGRSGQLFPGTDEECTAALPPGSGTGTALENNVDPQRYPTPRERASLA